MATTTVLVTSDWTEVSTGKCVITPCLSNDGFDPTELPLNSLPNASRFFVHFGDSEPAAGTKNYHVVPGGVNYSGSETCYMRIEYENAFQWFAVTEYTT